MLDKIAQAAVKSAMKTAIKATLSGANKQGMRGEAETIAFEADANARKKGVLAWTEGYVIMTDKRVMYKAWRFFPTDPREFNVPVSEFRPSKIISKNLGGAIKFEAYEFAHGGRTWEFQVPRADDKRRFEDTLKRVQG